MEMVVVGVGIALPFFVLWRLSRKPQTAPLEVRPDAQRAVDQLAPVELSPHDLQEARYIAGDGEWVLENLDPTEQSQFVAHSTALGRYREALAGVDFDSAGPRSALTLLEVNLAETLMELGRLDEALQLLNRASDVPLIESGRRCARAWLLTGAGKPADALRELEHARVDELFNYAAEFWFTKAFAQLALEQLAEAEDTLVHAKAALVRASSARNFEFLVAQLRWKQGRRDEALKHFDLAAKHRWRWQGGAGLLAWGDALKELGRDDEARAAWAQCIAQDPQSLAAIAARERR